MTKLMRLPVLVNAGLFQGLWFAAVLGSANGLLWPSIAICTALLAWQLHPSNRHPNDLKVVLVAVAMGLVVDSLWVSAGLLEFTDQRPIQGISPLWIMALWVGFALTINHSLSWLKNHPLLPILSGGIGGPLSYYAGLRFGAVEYLADPLLVTVCLAVAWAAEMVILVRVSVLTEQQDHAQTA